MPFSSLATSAQGAAQILSNPTWDVILLLVLAGGGLFWAFLAGRRKIISTIMLTYVALAIFPAIPAERLARSIGLSDPAVGTIGVFFILFVLIVWLLGARRGRPFSPGGPWWQVLFLSFVQAGLLIHIVLTMLPSDRAAALSPLSRAIFANPSFHLWWLVAPAVLLVIIRRLSMREE